MFQEVRLKYW